MTDQHDDPRRDAEDHAAEIVAYATVKAAAYHLLAPILIIAGFTLLTIVTWALALYGAFTLPNPYARIAAVAALGVLAGINLRTVLKGWRVARQRRARDTSPQQAKEELRGQFDQVYAGKKTWPSGRFWLRWLGLRVPASALAFSALDSMMPRPGAVACAAVLAAAPIVAFLPPVSRLTQRRTTAIVDLLTAEGPKPTPEI